MSKIIAVDDDAIALMMVERFLTPEYEVHTCQNMEALLDALHGQRDLPDLILLDYQMPGLNGLDVLERLKADGYFPEIPVVMVTGDKDVDVEVRCFNEGVSDFVNKPFIPNVLSTRIRHVLEQKKIKQSLETQVKVAQRKASQDPMTGLYNRSYAREQIGKYLAEHGRGSFAMVDLDNFKYLNDVYGHSKGDEAILLVAQVLQEVSGQNGIPFRLGGDEFGIFFFEANMQSLVEIQVLEVFAAYNKRAVDNDFLVASSLSMGIAMAPENGTTYEELYDAADKALYSAKRNGKNGYAFYSSDFTESRDSRAQVVDIRQLKQLIEDKKELRQQSGVYRVDYREFQRIYNFLERCEERSNQKATLVLISLKGDSGNISGKDFEQEMIALDDAVMNSLRRNDVSTRYSASQILLVLVDVNNADGVEIVKNRIKEQYKALSGNQQFELVFEQMPIQAPEE